MNILRYQKIPKTPFIPFYLPDGIKMSMMNIIDTLYNTSPNPLVIFLVHHSFDIPDPQQYPLNFQTIKLPKAHTPDGPAFSKFKDLVYNFLKLFPTGLIGICTNQRCDLCGYFIVRWLIEERGVPVDEAKVLFSSIIPQGITKPKYLNSISEIYQFAPNSYTIPDSDQEDETNLIKVNVNDESLRHYSKPYIVNRNEDPILSSVGLNVQPRETDQIMSDVRLLLNLQPKDFLVQPYYRFNSSVAKKIYEDSHSLYMVMLEPPGRRCLLYITGPDRFLVGDNGFLKQVNLYLPEHEKRDQCLSSAILEGTLARESEDSVKTQFYITDVFLFDGDDVRNKSFDSRMGIIYQKIIKFRKEQQQKKYNTEHFDKDDLSITIRPYLRLKYIDTIFENPSNFINLPIDGLVFASKSPPTTRSQISFMWKSDSREDITVKIVIQTEDKKDFSEEGDQDDMKIKLDENVKPKEKVIGMMYSTTTEDMCPAVIFEPITPLLRKCEGKLVDIDITDPENRILEIRGVSEHSHTSILENFYKMLGLLSGNSYTQNNLKKDIHQIILLPRYIEEDRSKSHKKSQ